MNSGFNIMIIGIFTFFNNLFIFVIILLVGNASTSNESPVYVKCDSTKGPIKIAVYSDWAPIGDIFLFINELRNNLKTKIKKPLRN